MNTDNPHGVLSMVGLPVEAKTFVETGELLASLSLAVANDPAMAMQETVAEIMEHKPSSDFIYLLNQIVSAYERDDWAWGGPSSI